MNIGEYLREAMSVAAYDDLLDRLDAAVSTDPPEPEDLAQEQATSIEDQMRREAARIYRAVRTQIFNLNPTQRQTTREQGRHLAFCRLNGREGYAVIERVPVADEGGDGGWRDRPITQVFWQAPEGRWRCGCREFVRTLTCDHVDALAVLDAVSRPRRGDADNEADARLCGCGHPAFVNRLCTICHLVAEERWLGGRSEAWRCRSRANPAHPRIDRRSEFLGAPGAATRGAA